MASLITLQKSALTVAIRRGVWTDKMKVTENVEVSHYHRQSTQNKSFPIWHLTFEN